MREVPILTFLNDLKLKQSKYNFGQDGKCPPPYQRGVGIWKTDKEQKLINTILMGGTIPPIFIRRLYGKEATRFDWEVVDGQQRIRALLHFFFPESLGKNMPPLRTSKDEGKPQIVYIGSKQFNVDDKVFDGVDDGVPNEVITNVIEPFRIILCQIEKKNGTTDAQYTKDIYDQFFRLNNGSPLSSAEIRNARQGKFSLYIREHSIGTEEKPAVEALPFLKKIKVSNYRKRVDELLSQLLCFEIYGLTTSVTKGIMDSTYEKYADGLPSDAVNRMEEVLSVLNKIFKGEETHKELVKLNVITMYMIISSLLYQSSKKILMSKAEEMFKWFDTTSPSNFVNLRKTNAEFEKACNARGASTALQTRLRILMSDLAKNVSNIPTLDDVREYKGKIRTEIFDKFKGVCANPKCDRGGYPLERKDKWEIDHIVPWIHGGKTDVNNGQLLCRKCNREKGAKLQ